MRFNLLAAGPLTRVRRSHAYGFRVPPRLDVWFCKSLVFYQPRTANGSSYLRGSRSATVLHPLALGKSINSATAHANRSTSSVLLKKCTDTRRPPTPAVYRCE